MTSRALVLSRGSAKTENPELLSNLSGKLKEKIKVTDTGGDGFWNPTHGHTGDVLADIVYGGVDDNGFILLYGLNSTLPSSSDTSNARQQLVVHSSRRWYCQDHLYRQNAFEDFCRIVKIYSQDRLIFC